MININEVSWGDFERFYENNSPADLHDNLEVQGMFIEAFFNPENADFKASREELYEWIDDNYPDWDLENEFDWDAWEILVYGEAA